MGRPSAHNLPPGIQLDQHGVYWATLEGDEAKRWRERYPGKSLPRRKAKTLKEVVKLQRQLIDDLKSGRNPNADNPKFVDLVRAWIDGKRSLQASTLRRYEQSFRCQIEPHKIGKVPIQQLAHYHFEGWVSDLQKQPRQDNPAVMLDPYSIRNAFAVARAVLNTAVRQNVLVKNPCLGVELPVPDDDEIEPLTPAQVKMLLAKADTFDDDHPHRLAALYYVACYCGLRQGELLGLRHSDIQFDRRQIQITGQMQNNKKKRGKTKQSHRTVPMTSATIAALRWHLANQREEQRLMGETWNPKKLLFCSEKGTPVGPSNLTRNFKMLLKHAKLPNTRFHDLRHTYASLAIATDMNIYTLMRRMGHSSITLTANTYGHLYSDQTGDIDVIDRLVKDAA